MTPLVLNEVRNELMKIYNDEIAPRADENKDNIFHQDLNKIVAQLEDNPEGGKPKQGRRKKVKDLSANLNLGSKLKKNQQVATLLGKREREDDPNQQTNAKHQEIARHHDDLERQISALSDVRYQPSDISVHGAGRFIADPSNRQGGAGLTYQLSNLFAHNSGALKPIQSRFFPQTNNDYMSKLATQAGS